MSTAIMLTECLDLSHVQFTQRATRGRKRRSSLMPNEGTRAWNEARTKWAWLWEQLIDGRGRRSKDIWPSLLPPELRRMLGRYLLFHKRDEMETLAKTWLTKKEEKRQRLSSCSVQYTPQST